jgi:DHA2 family multidrug resistance protein-like MFS transporter
MHNADPRRWLILIIVASGLLLICIDITVLYVALPALTRDLAATNAERLWILNAYPIVVAGLLPGFGTLGDRYGHRRLFTWGLVTFGSASLSAAFSPTAAALVIARAGLGVGAAMMMPATLAIIRTTFTDQRERTLALGVWAGVASAGMAGGPLVAGLLLSRFTWGSVFLINVPVVALAFVATLYLVPRRAAPGGPPWDIASSAQLLVALTALMYAIKEPARQDWSPLRLLVALAITALALALYLRRQARRAHPLLDLSLFRIPDFGGAFAAACLGTTGAVGMELVLSQYLQLVELREPLSAALVLLPVSVAGLIGAPLAARIVHHVSLPHLAFAGFTLAAACIGTLALLSPSAPSFEMLRLGLLGGVGMGMAATVTFASATIMNAAPPERGGMAASIEEVGFELGGALGVAVFGSIMTFTYASTLLLPEALSQLPATIHDSFDEALRIADTLSPDDATNLRAAGAQAFTNALRAVLLGIGLLWMATGVGIMAGSARNKTSRN